MALRIRLPLGLLATVTGYGLAGAGAGVLLIPDFLGYAPRLALLCAIGGGLLGMMAWRLSERLADAVNLNTRPVQRLSLAGAAAILLATFLAGAFGQLAVGTTAVWVPPAMVALFVLAGLPPLAAVLTLLAALETVLAARRGGANVLDSVRPLARSAAAAALAAGAIGYGLAEHSALALDIAAALAPERPRVSLWNTRQEALFAQVLAGTRCEVLVAPLEAGESSVDRVARSMMTRLLAAEVAARGLCVADPTLVARALGVTRRQLDERALSRLAAALSARWILRGEVTLEAPGHYAVALSAWQRQGAGFAQAHAEQLPPAAFSDALPPEAVFANAVGAVVDRLEIAPRQPPADSPPAAAGASNLPDEPVALAEDPGLPRLRALRLQLLAAVHVPGDVDGEHLWERSLVALHGLDDEPARVLRARAALHLYRRPYALALLEGLQSIEAQAVRAAAQGDLPGLEAIPPRSVDAAFWLVTRIEAERLRKAYGVEAGAAQRMQPVLEAYPAYRPWLGQALILEGAPGAAPSGVVADALDALGVEVPPFRWSWLLRAAEAVGRSALPAGLLEHDVQRTYAPLWQGQVAQWRAQRADDRVAQWDLFDALYAAHRAGLVTALSAQAGPQATPEQIALLGRVMALQLAGDAAFTATLARTWDNLAARAAGAEGSAMARSARHLARDVQAWEQGESEATQYLGTLAGVEYQDEPAREWRFASARDDASPPEQELTDSLRALELTTTQFAYLERSFGLLRRLHREHDAQQLLAQQRPRFVGHPAREQFLLARAEESANLPALAQLLQARLVQAPQAWEARAQLARTWLRAGDAAGAWRTLTEDPIIGNAQAPAAERAARLHDAGQVLHCAGESHLAAMLFQQAAAAAPESVAGMHSAQLLAQLTGEYRAARDKAQQLYDRHASAAGLADAAYYSFMLGEMDRGWRAFYEASRVAHDYRPWAAALAGHRMAASKPDDIVKFAQLWKGVSPQPQADALRKEHFVFNHALVDRRPAEEALQRVRSFGGKSGDDLYQITAEGYAAWLGGDHARAAELLVPPLAAGAGRKAAHALPYATSALARAGRAGEARALLAAYQERNGRDFYTALAHAYLDGLEGKRDAAVQGLREALLAKPAGDDQAMPPSFQLLEACELLLKVTGEPAYRELLLDFARRQQTAWPEAWAFAFEAAHATDAGARQRALVVALYLDAESVRVQALPEPERKRAQQRLKEAKPF